MGKYVIGFLLLVLGLVPAGCSRLSRESTKSYATVVDNPHQDTAAARAACQRAAEHFDKGNLVKAEAALQEALVADMSYAPAHNNLGRIYFDRGELYLAAWEFEYARRLLPESADAVNNLGLVYEAAGQPARAIEYFSTALSLDGGNPEYLGNLARTLIHERRDPAQAAALLRDLMLHDTRPQWVAWAHHQVNLNEPVRTAFAKLEPSSPLASPVETITTPEPQANADLPPLFEPSQVLPPLSDDTE